MSTQIAQHIPSMNPLPPRYSSLEGTLSPEAANILRSLCAEAPVFSTAASSRDRAREMYPPRYSGVFQRSATSARYHHRHPRGSGIRYYTDSQSSVGFHPFEYPIRTGHGSKTNRDQSWATLKVFSRSSSTSASSSTIVGPGKVPKFTSKDLVQGSLDLNLDSPQNINSISLTLIGKIVTGSYEGETCTFLNRPIINWTRSHGNPRTVILNAGPTTQSSASSSSSSVDTTTRSRKFDGKLSGQYIWPFSFPFPSEITLEGDDRKYPAPQTFLERGESTTVQYSLVLKMTHGMLRADTKLQAGIVYVPEIVSPPASLLRQVAYSQGMRIPGPVADPLGWHDLSPADIFGKFSNGKAGKLQYTLSLANPLTYTRGTVIPIHLALRSSNLEILDDLPASKDITVRLIRRLQYYQKAAYALSRNFSASVHSRSRQNADGRQDEDMEGAAEEKVVIDQVIWQEPSATTEDTLVRHFYGEIHLPKDTQPSCGFRLFKISYAVELLSFSNLVFKSHSSPEVLLSHPVTIATQHGTGPIPIPATQPSGGPSSRARRSLTNLHPRMYGPAMTLPHA